MAFNARQFTHDEGWGHIGRVVTARAGYVADRDERAIRQMFVAQGMAGDRLENAVIDAKEELVRFCQQKIATDD